MEQPSACHHRAAEKGAWGGRNSRKQRECVSHTAHSSRNKERTGSEARVGAMGWGTPVGSSQAETVGFKADKVFHSDKSWGSAAGHLPGISMPMDWSSSTTENKEYTGLSGQLAKE